MAAKRTTWIDAHPIQIKPMAFLAVTPYSKYSEMDYVVRLWRIIRDGVDDQITLITIPSDKPTAHYLEKHDAIQLSMAEACSPFSLIPKLQSQIRPTWHSPLPMTSLVAGLDAR